MIEFFRRYKGISKDAVRLYRLYDTYERYLNDANSLVLNWYESMRVFNTRYQLHYPPASA